MTKFQIRTKLSKVAGIATFTAVVAGTIATGQVAQGAVISADTTGFDSGLNRNANLNNFFGVSFDSGPVGTFIQSFTLDLSADANAIFNVPPAPSLGLSNGVSASDISFAIGSNRKSLTATLANGAFVAGESLRFGVNTDGVGPSLFGIDLLDPGADFGRALVRFSAALSNGTSGSSQFNIASLLSPSRSVAVINIADPEPVPEPLTILGSLAAAGAGITLRRKQKQQEV